MLFSRRSATSACAIVLIVMAVTPYHRFSSSIGLASGAMTWLVILGACLAAFGHGVALRKGREIRRPGRLGVFGVFLAAIAVTAIPLLVNFLIVSMLFPAYLPRVDESTYVGLYLHSYFSGLFYSRPLLYVLVYTLFDAVTLGALSMAVTGLSVVFRSRIKAMVVPYLIMVAWHFVNDWIFSVLSCVGFNCNILNSIRSESLNNWPDIRAGVAEIILLFVFSLVSARFLKRREVV